MAVSVQLRSGAQSDFNGSLFCFMYVVYILHSEKCGRYYIGYCAGMDARLARHNAGYVAATKNCRPYKLIATKEFITENEAINEERRIKKQKSSRYIEWLIAGNWQTRPD